MATMIHTYPEICRDTIENIREGREIIISKWYKHSMGFIWCLNSKGYYHIWKVEKIHTNIGVFPIIHR